MTTVTRVAVVLATVSLGLILVGRWHSQPAQVDPADAAVLPLIASPTTSTPGPGPAQPTIAPAAPERIAIPELDFALGVASESLEDMAVAYNNTHPGENVSRAIYATDFYRAAWPNNYGGRAGMAATNTTYLTCHSSAIRELPCNALAPRGAVKPGYHLVLTTGTARVTYVIERLSLVKKADFVHSEEMRLKRPGWAVLTVCLLRDGRRTEYSWAIFARAIHEERLRR